MAIIYLRHPVHGTKIATMEVEAVYDEGNGWTRYEPGATAPPPDPDVNVLVAVLGKPEPEPEVIDATHHHPLDHDGDGKPGGSLPGPRRRRARQE